MNKAILMGRLTRDPEVRYSQNNLVICNFTLAIDRRFSRQGEEKQTDFIPIVTFGKTAEFCEKYFQKGQQVLVAGRIQTRSWDDNEGKKRYATEVVSDEVHFADSKRANNDYGAPSDDYGYYPNTQRNPSYGSSGSSGQYSSQNSAPNNTNTGRSTADSAFEPEQAGGGTDDGFTPIENDSDLPF